MPDYRAEYRETDGLGWHTLHGTYANPGNFERYLLSKCARTGVTYDVYLCDSPTRRIYLYAYTREG